MQHLQNSSPPLFDHFKGTSLIFFLKGKSPHRLTKTDKALLAKALPAAAPLTSQTVPPGWGALLSLPCQPIIPHLGIISAFHQIFLNDISSQTFPDRKPATGYARLPLLYFSLSEGKK